MKNIFRYSIISVLFVVTLICIFSEPSHGTNFSVVLFISKGIGFITAYILYKLIMYWNLFNADSIEDVA